ncbi:MAG: carboxypeptidase regulatory-like domain-containing protein [Gemmatimonadota bacterium]
MAAGLVLAAAVLPAQVVRGTVRDSRTGAPVPGAIVALDSAARGPDTQAGSGRSTLALAVLSDERGEFAVRAGYAGRFVLSVKRVGLQRYQTEPFDLAVGQTRRMDAVVAPIDMASMLATVTVLTDAPCARRPSEGRRVAALWEEARTALTASRLSLRDRLFRATIASYVRELAAGGERVLSENVSTRSGVTERAFVSLAAEELSAAGWVRHEEDGSTSFYAPDAVVLTSNEFLRDHCFSLREGRGNNSGLTGLAFEPVGERLTTDISGVMWLDIASYELRRVEFSYTGLAPHIARASPGGEVSFAMLPSGAWFVSSWFIRMPVFRDDEEPSGIPAGPGPRKVLAGYRQQGGSVEAGGGVAGRRTAHIVGNALDSSGRAPLRGSLVRIAGTDRAVHARDDGLFRLDSLAGGTYTLVLEHPIYSALGMVAAQQELTVADSARTVTAIQAAGTNTILGQLCPGSPPGVDSAVVRVVGVADPATGARTGWARLRYDTYGRSGSDLQRFPNRLEVQLDEGGGATFCHAPARIPVTAELLLADRRTVVDSRTVTPGDRSINVVLLGARR